MPIEHVVRRAQDGDPDAREALARQWLPIVHAAALAVTGRAADAEDATQEAFLRAFARIDTLRIPARFGPWLIQIARNAARDLRRRARPEVGLATWDPPAREMSGPGENPTLDAWRRLPEMLRLVSWMHVMLDLPVREIAALVGTSKSSVGRLLAQALERLKREVHLAE